MESRGTRRERIIGGRGLWDARAIELDDQRLLMSTGESLLAQINHE